MDAARAARARPRWRRHTLTRGRDRARAAAVSDNDERIAITESPTDEINRLHPAAQRAAGDALQLAKEAGDLLVEVKTDLPHGAFLPWLAEHCEVGQRQAQRSMRLSMNWAKPTSNPTDPEHALQAASPVATRMCLVGDMSLGASG